MVVSRGLGCWIVPAHLVSSLLIWLVMDESIYQRRALEDNSDGSQGGVAEHISVNERLAAYESWQGNSSSSEDEHDEVCHNGEDEVKSNEGDAQYVELDDDFEEFMSAPLAPMPQQEGISYSPLLFHPLS